jgi:hypothetical protein
MLLMSIPGFGKFQENIILENSESLRKFCIFAMAMMQNKNFQKWKTIL